MKKSQNIITTFLGIEWNGQSLEIAEKFCYLGDTTGAFIKSTNHWPVFHQLTATEHLHNDPRINWPPIHQPKNHRANDKICFKRLDFRKIFYTTQT